MGTRLHIILLRVVITIGVVVGSLMLLSAVKTKDSKPCSRVSVVYKNGNESGFLPKTEVVNSIRSIIQTEPVGAALERFDLRLIEQKIEQQPWVYDAQMYFDNNQALHVVIDEAVPVARVIDAGGNHFYLDRLGNELPLSSSYRADLPVFTGIQVKRNNDLGRAGIQRIIGLAEAIVADSFWMAQAAQIDISPSGKMELVPVIGNHTVELGFAHKPSAMLARLKLFYMAIAAAGKLDDYVKLNAAYENQVVGQRDSFRVHGADKMQAMDTYRKIITENKQVVNANSVVTTSAAGRIMSEVPENNEKEPKLNAVETGDKPEAKTDKTVPAARQAPKLQENANDTKEEKKPKALMPKLDNN